MLFRCFAEGKTPFIRGDLAKLLLYALSMFDELDIAVQGHPRHMSGPLVLVSTVLCSIELYSIKDFGHDQAVVRSLW